MRVTTDWIASNYNKYNSELWGGQLPTIQFALSMSSRHGAFAQYVINRKYNTIHPTKILFSNYWNFTEEEAVNTLLHEMIHIADYTFHPEHFLYGGYDSHFGDFFQSEKNRLNNLGFVITETLPADISLRGHEAEIKRLEAERKAKEKAQKEMSDSGSSLLVAVLYEKGRKDNYYLCVWTEEKYKEKIYYGAQDWNDKYMSQITEIRWYRTTDTSALNFPECKGKIMDKCTFWIGIDKPGRFEEMINKHQLQYIETWKVKEGMAFDYDKQFFLKNMSWLLNHWKEKFIEAFKYNYSFKDSGNKFLHGFEHTKDYNNKRNKKEYWITLGSDDNEMYFRTDKVELHLQIPYTNEELSILNKIQSLREEKKLTMELLDSMLNRCAELIQNQIMDIIDPKGNNMVESRINRIVTETINRFIREEVNQSQEDPSIVSKKELENGDEIITQW